MLLAEPHPPHPSPPPSPPFAPGTHGTGRSSSYASSASVPLDVAIGGLLATVGLLLWRRQRNADGSNDAISEGPSTAPSTSRKGGGGALSCGLSTSAGTGTGTGPYNCLKTALQRVDSNLGQLEIIDDVLHPTDSERRGEDGDGDDRYGYGGPSAARGSAPSDSLCGGQGEVRPARHRKRGTRLPTSDTLDSSPEGWHEDDVDGGEPWGEGEGRRGSRRGALPVVPPVVPPRARASARVQPATRRCGRGAPAGGPLRTSSWDDDDELRDIEFDEHM